ncbi:MAG: 6,7-dimethyl-8-ribityllumazine synthase [Bifidobacteriaceae bacterium]|jgi:6,7-dimethyl-8-ribityllumazine synthase|nr:6,7-dimethyl-8-ribityllumazine synthase [Bifidobacteriaceae bacterium]
MSGSGAPALAGVRGDGRLIAVVASSWHQTVMDGLIAGAMKALSASGAQFFVWRVPGAFELPLAVQTALRNTGADCAVALGVVLKGGTPHFEYVCRAVTDGLTQVVLQEGRPVGFGILTCDDEAQALDRAGLEGSSEDKGYEAAQAALATMVALGTPAGRR